MVALMLVVLMGAVALAVDVGGLYLRRRELVNGADSAALAAARSCARGIGNDAPWARPEDAADYQAQQNSLITADEVADTNLTLPASGCLQPSQYGRVSAQYTSMQALHFAPVLGFDNSSPVTTAATASWGFGSNGSMPMVLSYLSVNSCPIRPDTPPPAIGQTCAYWFDNDTLNNGNFTFLSLDPGGWGVPIGANCNQTGGASSLTGWIDGSIPMSVVLNWTDPTYVCSDSGVKGVGQNNNSQVWRAVQDLADQQAIRDFPVNWPGPGRPIPTAPEQGNVIGPSGIDKYDIIGFAAMKIIDVQNWNKANALGSSGTCSGKTRNNTTVLPGTYLWTDFATRVCSGPGVPPSVPLSTVNVTKVGNLQQGTDFTFTNSDITLNVPLPEQSQVTFDWTIAPVYGPCGPPPASNHSAMCVVMQWQGSTVTGDYPTDRKDSITVVRLCDPTLGNCLDQRHGLP